MDALNERSFFPELARLSWSDIGAGHARSVHRRQRSDLAMRRAQESPTLTEVQAQWSRDVAAKSVACAIVQSWSEQHPDQPFPVAASRLKTWTQLLIQQYTFARLFDFFLAFNDENPFPAQLNYAGLRGMFVFYLESQSAWLEGQHRRQTTRTHIEQARVSDRLNQYFPKEMAALQSHFQIDLFKNNELKNTG